jgi:hypothetical protein
MKRLLFASIVIILVAAVTSCRSPNDADQPRITSNDNLTVEESSGITGLPMLVPEYFPPEHSTVPETASSGFLYKDLTLEQASEIIGLEIPAPTYLPSGYAITSVELKLVSESQTVIVDKETEVRTNELVVRGSNPLVLRI